MVGVVPKPDTVFTGVLQIADSKRILLQYQYDEKTNTAKRVQTEQESVSTALLPQASQISEKES